MMRVKEGETREWAAEKKVTDETQEWGKEQEKRLWELQEENQRLQQEKEMLMSVVGQMRITLDRMIRRYVVGERKC